MAGRGGTTVGMDSETAYPCLAACQHGRVRLLLMIKEILRLLIVRTSFSFSFVEEILELLLLWLFFRLEEENVVGFS